MKNIIVIILASSILLGCELISDILDEDDNDSLPKSTLYGISFFDEAPHFVKVPAKTGALIVLSKLDGITGIRGQAAINPELNQYYFTSDEKFVVIDVSNGSIIKSFELEYPNTGNMQYNIKSKKINAISNFNEKMHFVEIDVAKEEMTVIRTLETINGYYDGSASIDSENNKYYFMAFHTIYTLNTKNGIVIDSLQMDSNVAGLCLVKDDVLFGPDMSSHHFSTVNMETDKIKKLYSFEGNITGHPSTNCEDGFYYYFSDSRTLNSVNVKTGVTILSHVLPYNTNNLVPL